MPAGQRLSIGIVFDDTLDSSDGVSQYVKTLGAWLKNQGHEVSYLVGETITKTWAGGKVYSLARNKRVFFNGNKLSIPLPARSSAISEVLGQNDFDVIHVMMPYSPFMAQKVINRVYPNSYIVGTFHIFPSGWLVKFGMKLLRLMYGSSIKKFSMVVSVSAAAEKFATSSLGLSTKIVPNPVDVQRFKLNNIVPGDKKIVFLGRLVRRKGCGELLRAFALLSPNLPDAQLIIAGDGPDRKKLERLARKLNISGKTKFLGFIKEDEKPALLASADIACFPSLYGESFGIVLIEAMAAGASVVLGGDNPGYRSVLGEQPQSLINPSDTRAFSQRLHELLTNQDQQQYIHAWQQKTVRQYDINVVGKQIESIYAEAIARANKKGNNIS
jgi:phosphatidylinositol alpha-mannosyltransferase